MPLGDVTSGLTRIEQPRIYASVTLYYCSPVVTKIHLIKILFE